MPNIAGAIKRVEQSKIRAERMRARRSRVRTYVRRVERLISEGKSSEARVALSKAVSEFHRGVSKGAFKAKTASRRLSRLSYRVKQMIRPDGVHVRPVSSD